ncbi:MAG: chaperone modulator CbpM [Gammaproteobacteria bacterium]
MSKELLPLLSGCILEEETELTLNELCRTYNVHAELIVELVEEGALEPSGKEPATWIFTGSSLKRIRAAIRLHSDLGINPPGVALALQLLDELESLRARMQIIESRH